MFEQERAAILRVREEVDREYPNLRIRNLSGYHALVVSRLHKVYPHIGLKAGDINRPISANVIGISYTPNPQTGMQDLMAVDYVRDERSMENPQNPLRYPPEVFESVLQYWVKPAIIDEGGNGNGGNNNDDKLKELEKKFDELKTLYVELDTSLDAIEAVLKNVLKALEELPLDKIALVGDPVEVQGSFIGFTIKGKGTILKRKVE